MKTPTYKVGDLVTNHEPMIGIWHAMIYKVRRAPKCNSSDGHAYETLGFWEYTKQHPVGSPLHKLSQQKQKPSLRQLWADHLTPDAKETAAALRAYIA